MLIFSRHRPPGRAGTSAIAPPFTAFPEFPDDSARLTLASLQRLPRTTGKPWKVLQMNCDVDDAAAMKEWLPLFQEAQPLLLYLHGYHGTPADCFERCDRLQSLYGLEIVRFSWSARKHLADGGPPSGHDGAAGDPGLQRELAWLLDLEKDSPFAACLAPAGPAACDLEDVTCSWWLLMALPGLRH